MKIEDIKKIGDSVKEASGLNIFDNTRRRDYVEMRALVCYVLRKKLRIGLTNIALYFQSEGKTMHHATVIHLVNQYPIYKRYNPRLAEIEDSFEQLNNLEFNQDSYIRNQYLSYNYDKLQEKYKNLKDNIKTNPILDVLQDIPEDKIDEVIERINILKKSWDWKSKDECKVIEANTSMEGMHW
jgi:hypothetical protein